jgi:hypothetical protein
VIRGNATSRQRSELERLAEFKQTKRTPPTRLGPQMMQFFKQSVQKQQHKLARIAECWEQLVPPSLSKNCCLESLHRGVLTVLVDNASQLYELKQLLLAGLDKQLLLVCQRAGLRKISLRPGRWYEGDETASRPRF